MGLLCLSKSGWWASLTLRWIFVREMDSIDEKNHFFFQEHSHMFFFTRIGINWNTIQSERCVLEWVRPEDISEKTTENFRQEVSNIFQLSKELQTTNRSIRMITILKKISQSILIYVQSINNTQKSHIFLDFQYGNQVRIFFDNMLEKLSEYKYHWHNTNHLMSIFVTTITNIYRTKITYFHESRSWLKLIP